MLFLMFIYIFIIKNDNLQLSVNIDSKNYNTFFMLFYGYI